MRYHKLKLLSQLDDGPPLVQVYQYKNYRRLWSTLIGFPYLPLLVFLHVYIPCTCCTITVLYSTHTLYRVHGGPRGACVKVGLPDHHTCGGKKERAENESRLDRRVFAG